MVTMNDLTFGRSRGGLARPLLWRAPHTIALYAIYTLSALGAVYCVLGRCIGALGAVVIVLGAVLVCSFALRASLFVEAFACSFFV